MSRGTRGPRVREVASLARLFGKGLTLKAWVNSLTNELRLELHMQEWISPDFEEIPVNAECSAYAGVATR